MMRRWTLWESRDGEPLQLALCLLDRDWEPLWERTLQCGPFNGPEERRLELLDEERRWFAEHGYQEVLGF